MAMPMAIGTSATAPLADGVLQVVGSVAARTEDLLDQYPRQHRRHDEPARVDEPFQLLALDGASPAVTERPATRWRPGRSPRSALRRPRPGSRRRAQPARPRPRGCAPRGASGDGHGSEGVTESPCHDCGMPAAHATGRQRREGSEPVGKSSRTNTTNPMPKKIHPAQPVAPGPGPGELQQQQPGGGDRIRQAGGGQEPADRVRRAFPREQRADGGEAHDERHRDRAVSRVSRAAASAPEAAGEPGCRSRRWRPPPESAPRCSARTRMRPAASWCGRLRTGALPWSPASSLTSCR